MSDVVVPRALELPLSRGRSITVKSELNHGEYVAMLARMYRTDVEKGIDPLKTADALIVAYLIDWTIRGPDGERIEIRGQSADKVQDAINNLRQPLVLEIKAAIEAHDQAQRDADETLKKTESIDGPSLVISR